MPKEPEFSDYESVVRTKGSRSTKAKAEAEEWIRPYGRKAPPFGADSATDDLGFVQHSVSNEELSNEELKPVSHDGREKQLPPKEIVLRRGHGLTYKFLFLFTVVLLFRPYELFPALSWLTSIALLLGIITLTIFVVAQLALEGTLTMRSREVNLVFALTALAFLSIPLALNPAEAWFTFNDVFFKAVLIFIVIVNVVRTERKLNGLLFLSLTVSVFLSVAAINDYRVGNLAIQGIRIRGAIGGMFGNPNDMALHLVTMFPLAIAFLLTTRRVFLKVLFGICAALFIGAVVATFSRGGFLGLVGAGIVLTWKFGRRKRFVSILLAVVATVMLFGLAPGGYGSRVLSIFGLAPDSVGSAATRKTLLTHSLYTSLRKPFGIGMGNYHIIALHEGVSHNAYTQVAAEMGFAALLVYIAFMVVPLRRLRQIERETQDANQLKRFYFLAIGLQAGLVGYMISSFFASVAYQWYVYYLVAYAVCLRRLYEAETGKALVLESQKGKKTNQPSLHPLQHGQS